jgi:hypothetical protein
MICFFAYTLQVPKYIYVDDACDTTQLKPHEPDKEARMKSMLKQTNPATQRKWTQAQLDELPNSFWNDSCRRKIPPPSELGPRLQACYMRHVNDVDTAGVPLFTPAMAACHERQLQLIQAGFLSG